MMVGENWRWLRAKMGLLFAMASCFLLVSIAPASAMYSSNSDVVQLEDSNFKDTVLKSDGVWMVEFYAPWCGHCKNLKGDWEKAASALKGVVGVAAVDATVAKGLASKYQIKGFPTIKVFGADKRNPTDYNGNRDASSIVTDAMANARALVKSRQGGGKKPKANSSGSGAGAGAGSGSKDGSTGPKRKPSAGGGGSQGAVVTLNSGNFKELVLESEEMWLVEFFAPWCGHCKQLAPEWASAASQLQGTINLGAVDATAEEDLARQYGVGGYPTIKVFLPGSKGGPPEDYNGPREAAGIVQVSLEMLERTGWTPGVAQLTDKSLVAKKCKGSKICVIAALPHILDTRKAGREEYLEKVKAGAKKSKNPYLSLMWSEGGAQLALEEATGLTFGFPALVAISVDKKAYAVHVGAFSVDGIASFLGGLTTGSTKTKPLDKIPAIVTVEPWDEKDAQVVEEEFSLEDLFDDEEL